MPHLARWQETLGERGLSVIAVHEPPGGTQTAASLGAEAARLRIPFPVLLGDEATKEAYGVNGIPTRVLLDRRCRVLFREVGFSASDLPDLERRLDDALR